MGKTVEYFDVDITQKQLQAKTNIVIPSGNVNSYALRLHISGDEWDGLAPIVSFFHQERKYLVTVTDSVAVIPASVLKMRGRFCFGVFATQLDEAGNLLYRFSTNLQKGLVTDGAYSDNEAESDASDIALYEQLISQMKTVVEILNTHAKDFDNPHEVTAEQVGTYKKSEIDQKTAPLEEHLKNFSNPHEVTAEQVGTYSKAEIDAQAEVTAKALEDANSEIAAKLSKTTESYPTDRVYGVSMAGEQVMLEAHRDSNNVGGIPVYDNNGVIKTGTPVKDTDSVNKKYVDDKAAGKLDKVKSDFLLYPGVYTAADTDGTPYLLTATSDLGYIGKTGGYIATYDGGELKTGTPTADDSAANKAYVDEKVKVSKDYKLLATLNFTENASTFTVTTLNGQAIALKSMAVIMNRIGDGESANGYITPIFTTKDATGVSRDIKGGYFYGIGANGNSWYTRAEISGDFIDVEGVCMSPGTNAQISNGCMSEKFSRVMSWRNLSDDFLPITQITGFKITASGNCITNGSTMWIYGKEE